MWRGKLAVIGRLWKSTGHYIISWRLWIEDNKNKIRKEKLRNDFESHLIEQLIAVVLVGFLVMRIVPLCHERALNFRKRHFFNIFEKWGMLFPNPHKPIYNKSREIFRVASEDLLLEFNYLPVFLNTIQIQLDLFFL